MQGWKPVILLSIGVMIIALILNSPAFSNTYPPTPTQHFYGDADGDTAITVSDLNIVTNYLNAQPYTFGTLQPQNPDQDWNTCDVDSDQALTVTDRNILANYIFGQPVTISDKPWHIVVTGLVSSGNTAGNWMPFNVNVYSTSGINPSGRPGISVVAEIAPQGSGSVGTGQLKGRDCNPMGVGRDQAAADGAQCALAVTQTDWGAQPGQGLTESGTYGLQVNGDGNGDIKLNIRIEENAALDIPALTTSIMLGFDQIDINCSNTDETAPISCPVTVASGPASCAIGAGDTCGGSIDVACVGPYTAPAQGEAKGPGTCVAEVVKSLSKTTKTVNILEVNQTPWVESPSGLHCGIGYPCYFPLATSDPDLPRNSPGNPGYITCSCFWWAIVGPQHECDPVGIDAWGWGAAGLTSCTLQVVCGGYVPLTVAVRITDGYGATSYGFEQVECGY